MSTSGVGGLSSEESAKDHELLIHTLTHEHSVDNIPRHKQVLMQWTRDYAEGFFIRDLQYVIRIFGILRERLANDRDLFREVVSAVFKVAALPLFEAKANERLKEPSCQVVRAYFLELCSFWDEKDPVLNAEIGKCFRSIVNGGLDPTILKKDVKKWESDGIRKQVTDRVYLQTLLRDSTAVNSLVRGFLGGCEAYEAEFDRVNAALEAIAIREKEKEKERQDQLKKAAKNGLAAKKSNNNDEESDSDDDGAGTTGGGGQGEGDKAAPSSSSSVDKTLLGDYQELMKVAKCLMMELSEDARTAALMCAEGLCNGATRLLRIAASNTVRDPQVASSVDLIWTTLDNYLSLVPPTTVGGADEPAPQPPSPTFGSPQRSSMLSLYDGGAEQEHDAFPSGADSPAAGGSIVGAGDPPGPSPAAALILGGRPLTLTRLLAQNVMDFNLVVNVLLSVFVRLLHEGYRMADKECRNEVLICLSMISTFEAATSSFMSSGAVQVFTSYACIAEVGKKEWAFFHQPVAKPRNYGSVHDIDLQLKRELWLVVMDILGRDDPDALLVVASSPLLDTLLAYLEHDTFEPAPAKGSLVAGEGSQMGGSRAAAAPFSPSRSRTGVPGEGSPADDGNGNGNGSPAGPGTSSQSEGEGGGHELEDPSQFQSVNFTGPRSYLSDSAQQQAARFFKQIPSNQLLELQVVAATFLATSAPKTMGEFLRINGPVRILDVAYKYSRSAVPEHKALLYQCLLLLNRCLMLSDEVNLIMESENAIETFLTQFEHSDEDDSRTLVARLISVLCSGGNHVCQQQLREQNGIRMLVRVLLQYTESRRVQVGRRAGVKIPFQSEGEEAGGGGGDDSSGGSVSILVVAIIDSLQKGVVGNMASETQFAQEEGIDMLLNLLEVCQFIQRVQVLRILSDLLESSKLLPFVFAWRSPKSMRTAAQIFAHCWLDEEARLGVSRGKDGVIVNVEEPLANHDWPVDMAGQMAGESVSSDGSLTLATKSTAVARLSEAISHSRINFGLVSEKLRKDVLVRDTRTVLARIFVLVGVIDTYNRDPPGGYFEEDIGASSFLELGSQIIDPGPDRGAAETSLPVGADLEGSIIVGEASVDAGAEEEKGCDYTDGGKTAGNKAATAAAAATTTAAAAVNTSSLQEGGAAFGGALGASQSQSVTVVISNDPGLEPREKQVLAVANQYNVLLEGQWWRQVREELAEAGKEPVESDSYLIQAKIGQAFDASFVVQTEQMELCGLEQDSKKGEEEAFIGQVLAKKEQQIKTAWLRQHGKGGATANPHATVPY